MNQTETTAVRGLTIGLLIIFLLTGEVVLVWAVLFLLFIQQLSPYLTRVIGGSLHALMKALGLVLVRVTLAFIYLGFITPYSFLYRLFHIREFRRFSGRVKSDSYFEASGNSLNPEFFKHPW